jgi:hypothetical protein
MAMRQSWPPELLGLDQRDAGRLNLSCGQRQVLNMTGVVGGGVRAKSKP